MRNKDDTVCLVHKEPALWWVLKIFFPMYNFDNVATVFGKNIYIKNDPPSHLYAHERTHVRQQRGSRFWGTIWWVRYITSKEFRYKQELEAYRNQYKVLVQERRANFKWSEYMINSIINDLSGPLYNHVVTREQAKAAIINHG